MNTNEIIHRAEEFAREKMKGYDPGHDWWHIERVRKLARIINEQGRLQVVKGWGSARSPDCSGFSIAQLQALDFARMDLTEFYASIVPKLPDAAAIQGGAAGFIIKPFNAAKVLDTLGRLWTGPAAGRNGARTQ